MEQDHEYTFLGESGLVEDEEGNIYSPSEIWGNGEKPKPSPSPSLPSFVDTLDNPTNPAHWYNHYDQRYNGHSREEYMELMAQKARQRAAAKKAAAENEAKRAAKRAEAERQRQETARERADREQREAERLGLHTVFSLYNSSSNFRAVIDKHEKVHISNRDYTFVGGFRNGLAIARSRKTKKFGFVDIHGNERIPCIWRSVGMFNEYMAGVKDDHKRCGYVDITGQLVIPCTWQEAWPFNGGLAIVQGDNHRLGYIDTSGNLVIPCQFLKAEYFGPNGLARVSRKRRFPFRYEWVYIDRRGREVNPQTYKP